MVCLRFAVFFCCTAAVAHSADFTELHGFAVTTNEQRVRLRELAPAATCDTDRLVVVWKDNRNAPINVVEGPLQLYARIFNISGAEITGSLEIDMQSEPWTNPRYPATVPPGVAKFGRHFFVVWLNPFRHVYGRMISESGELQPVLFEFTEFANAYSTPGVAANRNHCMVVWETRENGSNQVNARVVSRNTAYPGPLIEIARNVGPMDPQVTSLGNRFLVVWKVRQWPGIIRAALVTSKGVVRHLEDWPWHPAEQFALAGNRRESFVVRSNLGYGGTGPLAFHVNRRGKYTQEFDLDGYPRECGYVRAVDTPFGGFAAVWFNGYGLHQAHSSTRRTVADYYPRLQTHLTNTPPVLTRSGSRIFVVREDRESTTNGLSSRVTLTVTN